MTGILPLAIKQLALSAPGLVLQIKPGTSDSLFADLADRCIDAAIIVLPPYALPSSYHFQVLREEPLILLSNQFKGKNVRQKPTQNPYICYDSQSSGGLKACQFLKDKGIDIKPYYELDALEAIEKLVQQEMEVSLVPQWSGLDLSSSALDAEFVRPNRYAWRVVLVTRVDNVRKQIFNVLNQALLTPLA